MLKKILFSVLSFFLGVSIAIAFEQKLRHLIQALFKLSTDDNISFFGKDFHLFASVYYYVSPGILSLLLFFVSIRSTLKQTLIHVALAISIFFSVLAMISYIDSNGRVAQCTACYDGRRNLNYNDINYDAMTILSLILASAPSLIQLIKNRKSIFSASV